MSVTLDTNNKLMSSVVAIECEKLPQIGGRIFYDDGDNGATYKFYDASGNEVNYDGTIASLVSATQYMISGTPTKDRFYVFNNELVEAKNWGKEGTLIGITDDGIGKGKTNTATALTYTGWESDSIFQYIVDCNNNSLNGCNDWFIASKAEQDKLRELGLVNWYGTTFVLTSVEYDLTYAYVWNCEYTNWYGDRKFFNDACFAARSF